MIYILIGLFVSWIFLFVQFTEKMKDEFPEKYEELGRPALLGFSQSQSFKAKSNFLKFLFKREYVNLGRSIYTILGNLLLIIYVVFVFGLFYEII